MEDTGEPQAPAATQPAAEPTPTPAQPSAQQARQSSKVFIGGLSWETTGEKLRAYFENYGVVREAFVSYNRNNGRPRGFGFVVFESPEVADQVVATPHTIDRRKVDAKKAVPKEEQPQSSSEGPSSSAAGGGGAKGRKIFVGGLAASVDDAMLREYFESYGEVEDAVVMYDHDNKRPRGFGFVTFAAEESVEAVFAAGAMQSIANKQIEIKSAVPRDQMPATSRGGGLDMRYGRGGYGMPHGGPMGPMGMRGGYGGRGGYVPTAMHPSGRGRGYGGHMGGYAGGAGGGRSGGAGGDGGGDGAKAGMLGGMGGGYGSGAGTGLYGPGGFGSYDSAALAYSTLASLQAQAQLNGLPGGAASAGKLDAPSTFGLPGGELDSSSLQAFAQLSLAAGAGAFPGGPSPPDPAPQGSAAPRGGYAASADAGSATAAVFSGSGAPADPSGGDFPGKLHTHVPGGAASAPSAAAAAALHHPHHAHSGSGGAAGGAFAAAPAPGWSSDL